MGLGASPDPGGKSINREVGKDTERPFQQWFQRGHKGTDKNDGHHPQKGILQKDIDHPMQGREKQGDKPLPKTAVLMAPSGMGSMQRNDKVG